MESVYYSSSWNKGLICLVHKSSKEYNPNDYRGITLSNCLGKLINNIIFPKGTSENHSTSDHIFTAFNITNEYIKNGKYLYTCFLDFQIESEQIV